MVLMQSGWIYAIIFAEESLEAKLKEFGLVWAVGGNTFLLRRAMRQSGFDENNR